MNNKIVLTYTFFPDDFIAMNMSLGNRQEKVYLNETNIINLLRKEKKRKILNKCRENNVYIKDQRKE